MSYNVNTLFSAKKAAENFSKQAILTKMKVFAENKKAKFNYEILEIFEAGLILNGQEVKSIKTRGLNLAGSYVIIKPSRAYWVGAHIPAYQPANAGLDYHDDRDRPLLLKKSELRYLFGKAQIKGLTFIPLRVYTNKYYESSGKIKLEFALARGRKKYDKREIIKNREAHREINRAVQNFNRSSDNQ